MANKKVVAVAFRDERVPVGISFPDPSLTVQASKDECDINHIVARYLRTGELPGVRQAAYADLSEIKGLKESLEDVLAAEELFMTFDAKIRARFDNDPVKMIEFASDKRNLKEAVELGLVDKDRLPTPPSQPSPVGGATAPATAGSGPTSSST